MPAARVQLQQRTPLRGARATMPAAEEPASAAAAYRALPVRLAPGAEELRYLFIRAHRSGPSQDAAADRTLFVAALPPRHATPRAFARLFAGAHAHFRCSYGVFEVEALMSRFGGVERVAEVRLASLPAPGAHVVFANAKVRARAQLAAAVRVRDARGRCGTAGACKQVAHAARRLVAFELRAARAREFAACC